jgi:hypothetical protein
MTQDNPFEAEYARLTTEEIGIIELSSFNFFQNFGQKIKIPPRLYDILKSGGVDMKHIEPRPDLEN